MARTYGGPTEGLFEEAEGVFDREAPQIPAPQRAQVSRQWTADPGQPQRPWGQLFVGQALDLDADHAEGSIWRATHVQLGPDLYRDGAVGRVSELRRLLRLAIAVLVGQPKRLTMQTRPTTPGTPFGGAIHPAHLDQAGITPLWGQPGSGRYSQVRSALARAAGRGQLVPSITHSGRPSTTAESTSVLVNRVRSRVTSTEPSASASHVLDHSRRNAAVKLSRTSVLR